MIENVEALALVYRLSGFKSKGWSRKGTIDWHCKCIHVLKGDWMKFYKYKDAAFYAAAEEQELPTSPFESSECSSDKPDVVLGGVAGRWAKALKKSDRAAYQTLAYSVLQAKRGMRRPDKKMLKEAEVEAFLKLTTVPVQPPAMELVGNWASVTKLDQRKVETTLNRETFRSQLKRTVDELLEGRQFTLADQQRMSFPSTSANYTKTRSKGGMVGELMSNGFTAEHFGQEQLVQAEPDSEGTHVLDDTALRVWWAKMISTARVGALLEGREAEFLALAEALKKRVITKGPALRNFVLKPLQKFLWSAVRANKAGTLVGETISAEYLCKQLGKLRDGEEYTSADYSDATNEIFSWTSADVIDAVGEHIGLSEDELGLAKQNLIGHVFRDPRNKNQFKEQVTGQLMGSILSFPVLCIVNMAIVRWSQELALGRSLLLADARMCVNGDDAVFRGPPASFQFWKLIAPFAGLKPSLGKVYVSRKFLNMNSTLFNVVPEWVQAGKAASVDMRVASNGDVVCTVLPQGKDRILFLQQVKYTNIGLIVGLKRSETRAAVNEVGLPESMGKVATWLVDSGPPAAREIALKAFLNKRMDSLKKTSLKWFLPEHLGGLGIPRPAGSMGQKGLKDDMRYAAAVYKFTKPVPRPPPARNWLVWEKIQARIKEMALPTAYALGEATEPPSVHALHNSLAVEALFRAKQLGDLFKDPSKPGVMKSEQTARDAYLKRLEKFGRAVKRTMGDVQPFAEDKLPSGYEPLSYPEFSFPTVLGVTSPPDWVNETEYDPDDDMAAW